MYADNLKFEYIKKEVLLDIYQIVLKTNERLALKVESLSSKVSMYLNIGGFILILSLKIYINFLAFETSIYVF